MSRSISAIYAAWCTAEVIVYSHFAKDVKLLAHRTGELSLESYVNHQSQSLFHESGIQ